MKYIILCGGIGKRCSGYSLPKPLNYVNGKHMIEHVIQNVPSTEIYIIYNIYLDKYNFQEIIINRFKEHTFHFSKVDYLTRGAVETAYVGIQSLDIPSDESIVFMDNDNMCTFSKEFINNPVKNDFIGYGIDYVKTNYSFVVIDKDINHIADIAEKVKISDNYCCGVYGFASVESFMVTAKEMLYKNSKTKNEFYFSQLYWNKIQNKEVILPVLMESAIHIGSYDEITSQQSKVKKTPLRICFDLDNTLVTYPTIPGDYSSVKPITEKIQLLNKLKSEGHEIIIHTDRRKQTLQEASIKDIALITIQTLERFNIPYDELIFGKPSADIYIDHRAMNPYINNISQFGLFYDEPEFIPNKISTNKNNTIERKGDVIYKTGPEELMKNELFYYQNIPPQFSHYFPKLIGHTMIDDEIQLQLEFISGIPLYHLYKNKLITEKIINDLVDIIHIFHNSPFENDTLNGKSNLLSTPDKVEVSEPMIHGNLGFTNIIITYNDEYKFIGMKGKQNDDDDDDDYDTLYQSILGNDLILNSESIDTEYIELLNKIYLKKCKDIDIRLNRSLECVILETRNECVICNNPLDVFFSLHNVPNKLTCVTEICTNNSTMDFAQCSKCNTIQLKKMIPLNILYEDSHNFVSVGKVWEKYFEMFINYFQNIINTQPNGTILEIGCPSGKVAQKVDNYKKYIIVDPNQNSDEKFSENIVFKQAIFDDDFIINEQIDIIVHSHLFEHIYEPSKFVKKCYDILNDEGEMYFGVPNMENFIEGKSTPFLGIFFEHTIFLNEENISYLLTQNGFEIIRINYYEKHSVLYHCKKKVVTPLLSLSTDDSSNVEFQTIPVANFSGGKATYEVSSEETRSPLPKLPSELVVKRLTAPCQITNYKDNFTSITEQYKQFIEKCNEKISNTTKKVYLFGASYNTQMLLLLGLQDENINGILDNCKTKQGKYLYGFKLQIYDPNILKNNDSIVILQNGYYNNEIMNQIQILNKNTEII